MTFIKRILGLLILIAIALIVVAYVLPRTVTVTRDIVINTPASTVFPLINNQQNTTTWSPWLSRDPNADLTFSGPPSGVGSKLLWASDDKMVGNGTSVITESIENQSVKNALDFGAQGIAEASFTLIETNGVTTVTWGLQADMGMNPMGRWMGLMMDKWVGGDYERGLQNLKDLAESL